MTEGPPQAPGEYGAGVLHRRLTAFAACAALVAGAALSGSTAHAETPVLVNPGPTEVALLGGSLSFAGFDLDLPGCDDGDCPSVPVTLGADGTFSLPLDFLDLPPIPVTVPIDVVFFSGDVDLEIKVGAEDDAVVAVIPATGSVSLSAGVVVSVATEIPGLLPNTTIPLECPLLRLGLDLSTVHPGGEPLDVLAGTAVLVDLDAGLTPATGGDVLFCPLLQGLLPTLIGGDLPDLSGRLELAVRFAPVPLAPSGFTDVPVGSFAEVPVAFLKAAGLTTGYGSPTIFAPNLTTTRGEVAAFLHRYRGEPAPATACDFDDVPGSAFFATAACWMLGEGITTGFGGNPKLFAPGVQLTRGQLATMLWRLAGSPEVDGAVPGDIPDTAFYKEAAVWMLHDGITTGVGGNSDVFAGNAPLTRGQLATFLYRLHNTPAAWSSPG